MRFCNHCGKPVSEGNQFCDYCGAELRAGSNTVPGESPFRPAADFDTQYAPAPQFGDNGFSAPGNISDFKVGFGGQSIPEPQPSDSGFSTSRPATDFGSKSTSDSRPKGNGFSLPGNIGAPTGDTVSDKKTGTDLPGDSPAPSKEKSPKKRILIAAACLAVVACVAVTLIFLLPKIHPTSGDTALSDDPIKLNDEVTSLVESYTDENGYVSIEECAEVAGIVRDYAEKLKQSHEIQDYAFDEKSGAVSFRFSNNTIYVYSPPLRDVLENGNEFSVMSISSFDGVIETAYSILDKPIHGTLGGPHQAAEYIHDNCPQCTQIDKITRSHCGPGELQEKLMTIGETNTRAIFFFGHGGLLPLESGDIWSIFAVGEDPTEKNNGKYCDMLAANEIVWRNSSDSYTGLCYAITPEFVKHYMAEVNGGLFFAGACHSAEDDGSMSNAFINKGFDCYIGYDNSVTATYNTSIMKYIAIYLSENDNGEFTDIHTALEKAKQECGETAANGTRCLCIDKDSKNPFRLSGGQETAPEPTEQVIIDSDSGGAWEDDSHGARTDSGTCGEQVKWELFEDGTLHIYGSGAMYRYSNPPEIPWFDFNQKVQSLQIDTGVTAIDGFYSCDSLTCVEISNSVTAIYDCAFKWCTSLTSVTIPDSVKTIGDCAFAGCSLIKKIVFRGDAPAFSDDCFSSVTATAYFPAGNATWTSDVMQNYGGSLTWVPDTDSTETNEPSTAQPETSGAVEFNGHRYCVYDVDTVTTWNMAQEYCEAQGGHLATITSAEEDAFIYSYIVDAGHSSAMFGLSDQEQTDEWRWVTGETLSYQNWHSGEPNHQGGYEHYGMYYDKFTDGTWNDGSGQGGPFICEWDNLEVNVPVSVEVIPGTAQRIGSFDVTVDTLSVTIFENSKAAEKIMSVFLEWREKANGHWTDFDGYYPGSESEEAIGFDKIGLTITRTDSKIISVFLFETTYFGGNYCAHSIKGYTFSTLSGDVLELSDLTADAGALKQELHDACWNQLLNTSEYSHLTSFNESFDQIFSEETYEWTLDSDGIRIYFPEYSIGSHADGIINFVVPYSDVAGDVYDWVISR